jgi:hypothetical protein
VRQQLLQQGIGGRLIGRPLALDQGDGPGQRGAVAGADGGGKFEGVRHPVQATVRAVAAQHGDREDGFTDGGDSSRKCRRLRQVWFPIALA